jgi:hypothetical protein
MGAQAKSKTSNVISPETYLGYRRGHLLNSTPEPLRDQPQSYHPKTGVTTGPKDGATNRPTGTLALNQWGLEGVWNIQDENVTLVRAPGKISFRFHARDLHLVLGPSQPGKPIRFRVRLDDLEPKENHGGDLEPSGKGVIREHRLYQLIRQPEGSPIQDRTFEIEFLDEGAKAFAFTFG